VSKQLTTLQDRLTAWADDVRKQAETMAPGPEQDALLKKSHRPTKPQSFTIGSTRRSFNRRSDSRDRCFVLAPSIRLRHRKLRACTVDQHIHARHDRRRWFHPAQFIAQPVQRITCPGGVSAALSGAVFAHSPSSGAPASCGTGCCRKYD
jgi:hypothetical protein